MYDMQNYLDLDLDKLLDEVDAEEVVQCQAHKQHSCRDEHGAPLSHVTEDRSGWPSEGLKVPESIDTALMSHGLYPNSGNLIEDEDLMHGLRHRGADDGRPLQEGGYGTQQHVCINEACSDSVENMERLKHDNIASMECRTDSSTATKGFVEAYWQSADEADVYTNAETLIFEEAGGASDSCAIHDSKDESMAHSHSQDLEKQLQHDSHRNGEAWGLKGRVAACIIVPDHFNAVSAAITAAGTSQE
jgi:hypothetical protein